MAFLRTGMQRSSVKPGGNRMGQIKEGLDSTVARILDSANTLYEAPPQPEPEKATAPAPRPSARMSFDSFDYGGQKPKARALRRRKSLLAEDSSDEERREEEEEALKHWTLEVADETIQSLIDSIKCDERLDALEALNASCSRNAASSEQLNSEMDQLEKQLHKEWQDMDQSISAFLEVLEEKERKSYDALRGYFQCIEQQTGRKTTPSGRLNRSEQARQAELRTGRLAPKTQPSEVLEVVHQIYQEMQKHRETLEMESKRQEAYAHALHKLQRAILFDEDPTRDQVTSQVLKEIRRWGLDAATEWEPESDEHETLSKTEYAMRVARVKTEIENLKVRLERYNAKKEKGQRRTSHRQSMAEMVNKEDVRGWRARLNDANLSLFNEVVERRFQEDLRELSKGQRNLEGFLRRFEDLYSLVEHLLPELEDSRMKIFEVTQRARPKIWQIERLPVLPSPEEQRVANFAQIRRIHDEEDEKEHKERLKGLQHEMEVVEKEANDYERRKTQLKQAIRQEQHLHDGLEAEIEDATAMMEGLDDNVNLVLAKDYMAQVGQLQKLNAQKELELFEHVKAAEQAETLQWKVAMTLDEMKVLAVSVLTERSEEMVSSESESLDSEPMTMEQQLSDVMEHVDFSRAGSKVVPEPSASLTPSNPSKSPSSPSFGEARQPSHRPGFARAASRRASFTVALGRTEADQSPHPRRQSLELGGATGSESPRPVSSTSVKPSGSLRPSGSLNPSSSVKPSPSSSLKPSNSQREKEQEEMNKARRQSMFKGATVLAGLMAKATAQDSETGGAVASVSASPQLPIGARARRKTMTRSDLAFAEIVAKAKAAARVAPEEVEPEENSSPKPSASMSRRRASALAPGAEPDKSPSKAKRASIAGIGFEMGSEGD